MIASPAALGVSGRRYIVFHWRLVRREPSSTS